MADTKISALTALVAGDIQHTSDVVAIVDTSVTTTKKATAQAVVNAVLAQNTDTTVTGTINQTTIPTSKTLLVSTDIGSTVQGYDAQLADVAGLAVTDGNFIVGNGTNFVAESGSTARTSLGLGTGDSPEFTAVNIGSATDTTITRSSAGVIAVEGSNVLMASNIGSTVQAYDAQLADVAGLTPTDNGVIIGNGANFVVESGATLKTSLGLTIGTDVQAYDADTAKTDVAQTFTAAQSFSSDVTLNAQSDLRFADSDSSNWVAFQSPATVSSNVTWTLPAADGTSNQALVTNGSGTLSWATASASPGGSNTQLQYNNSGAFGGISGVTSDGTRITASTTIGVGGATPSTSGAGITFPATASASSDANTLDDYEEGTWTPTITATTGTFTTTSASNGIYTIIGRVVNISVTVTLTTIGDASGALVLTLPISAASTSNSGNGAEFAQTGFNCQVWTHSTSVIRVRKYDFTTAIQEGNVINISLTYTI